MSNFATHPTYPTQNKTNIMPVNNKFELQHVTSTNLPFSINSLSAYQQNNLLTGQQYPPSLFNPYQPRLTPLI